MQNKKTILFAGLLLAILFLPSLSPARAFSLVPCGGSGQNPCTFDDLTIMGIRLVNLLFFAAAVVAGYHIVSAGWGMMSAMGNSEKLTQAKEGLSRAVIGFAIVLLSFAFINLLLGLMGITCNWWEPNGSLPHNLKCIIGL